MSRPIDGTPGPRCVVGVYAVEQTRRRSLRAVSVWLVVGDSELRALFLSVGEEAGIPLAAIEPETVAALLHRDQLPDAMLITRDPVPAPLDLARLQGVTRLAIASSDGIEDGEFGIHAGRFLKLPASLEEVEGTLRWLAQDGREPEPASSNDSSSRLA